MTEEIHPTAKEIAEAIDRIARTRDGADLYVFLQRRLMQFPTSDKAGALRADHGARRFASTLIGLMAKGILESDGRTSHNGDPSGSGSTEQPLVVPRAEPVSIGSSSARADARARAISAIDIGGARPDRNQT